MCFYVPGFRAGRENKCVKDTLNKSFIIFQTIFNQPGPPRISDQVFRKGELLSRKCMKGFYFLIKDYMKIPSSNNLLNYI
jgi:hypothetical protein